MKKLTVNLNESIEIPKSSINKISTTDLKEFYTITKKFLSDEAKEVIEYLIDHPKYATELTSNKEGNALGHFINSSMPSKEPEKQLWKNLKKLNKENILLQVPVFLTKKQFDDVLKYEKSIDEIALDMKSEKGRNKLTKQYLPLINKIVNQQFGSSNLNRDDLMSAALTGFTYAMNTYGKVSNRTKVSKEKVKSYTFSSYAAFCIRNELLENAKHLSRVVRVSSEEQKREKKSRGYITKNNTVSGDEIIGSDNDGNGKTRFDSFKDVSEPDYNLNKQDEDEIWEKINDLLLKNFTQKEIDIFYHGEGLWGHEKMKKKELAKKYKVVESNISYYLMKIKKFIMTNKESLELFKELQELYAEDRAQLDAQEQDIFVERYVRSIDYYDEGFEENLNWKIKTWFSRDISEKRKFNKLVKKCKSKYVVSDDDINEYLEDTNLLIEKFVKYIEDDIEKVLESEDYDIIKARSDYKYSFKKIIEYLIYSNTEINE